MSWFEGRKLAIPPVISSSMALQYKSAPPSPSHKGQALWAASRTQTPVPSGKLCMGNCHLNHTSRGAVDSEMDMNQTRAQDSQELLQHWSPAAEKLMF